MPRPSDSLQDEREARRESSRDDRPTRDDRDDKMRSARDATQRVVDSARDALEPLQSSISFSGPVLAARINDARAMTRSMMETQTRLAMAWVDLAWSPLLAMSRMMRAGQDGGAGTGAPGPR